MIKKFIHWFVIYNAFGLIIGFLPLHAFPKVDVGEEKTAWDTILVEIQVIEYVTQVDTIKAQLLKAVFDHYQITENDYRIFYVNFMQKPFEEQRRFLDRVKSILKNRNKALKQP